MIQQTYQKAIKFAGEAHSNQKLPGSNANYLVHISNVAMEIFVAYQNKPDFDLNLAIQIAILHDTIEDNKKISYNTIVHKFDKNIADGVLALSKNNSIENKKDRMYDSLNRILKQPKEIALVKLADRITNLQKPPNSWNKEKINAYYKEAKKISKELAGKHQYLDSRIRAQLQNYTKFTL
jgi:(p)ppGpp synthase/HD superfamily hydrolase